MTGLGDIFTKQKGYLWLPNNRDGYGYKQQRWLWLQATGMVMATSNIDGYGKATGMVMNLH